jgi:2-octaprenyl-6-methoxyphenol hydroxylase
MPQKTEVLISGGGIPALSAAILLAKRGIGVTIIEPSPPPMGDVKPSGRTAAVMRHGLNTLNAAGLDEQVLQRLGADLRDIRIVEAGPGVKSPQDVIFRADELDLPRFGVNLPLLPLHQEIWTLAKAEPNITLIEKDRISSLAEEPYRVCVTLTSGKQIAATLLISADGRQSATRQMAGIDTWQRSYTQAAMTCLLSHAREHDNISTEFHYIGGPFTLVPYKGKTSALVWVDERQRLEAHLRSPRADLEATMMERSQNLLGKIKIESPPDIWPLMALRAKALTAHRQILMAEAAHVVSPIGAQGLNLSLRDAQALDLVIGEALSRGEDIGSQNVLRSYDKARRLDVLLRVQGVDHMHSAVATPDLLSRLAKRGILQIVSGMPGLRHLLMKHGMGQAA